jgi:hypothetical protein
MIGAERRLISTELAGRFAGRSIMSVVEAITRVTTSDWRKISIANSYQEQLPSPAMWWMPYAALSTSRSSPTARWPV